MTCFRVLGKSWHRLVVKKKQGIDFGNKWSLSIALNFSWVFEAIMFQFCNKYGHENGSVMGQKLQWAFRSSKGFIIIVAWPCWWSEWENLKRPNPLYFRCACTSVSLHFRSLDHVRISHCSRFPSDQWLKCTGTPVHKNFDTEVNSITPTELAGLEFI